MGNPKLESVAGLSGLQGHAPGTLRVRNNPLLQSLLGLHGLKSCPAVDVDVTVTGDHEDAECTTLACLIESGVMQGTVAAPKANLRKRGQGRQELEEKHTHTAL